MRCPALLEIPDHADTHAGHVRQLPLGERGVPAVSRDQLAYRRRAALVHLTSRPQPRWRPDSCSPASFR
jgi:hypothetical protein